MSRIMFLGAGTEYAKAIAQTQAAGFEVVAIEEDPSADGRFEAEEFFPVDIHDKQSALEIARVSGVEGVLALTAEGIKTAAYIAQEMGLPGLSVEAVEKVHDMASKRSAWEAGGVSYLRCANQEEWHKKMLNGKGALVEAIVQKGDTTVLAVSETGRKRVEDHYINTEHLYPAEFENDLLQKIQETVTKGLQCLKIQDGPVHSELLIYEDEVYLLNQYPTPPEGGIFSTVVEQVCGVQMATAVCAVLTGDSLEAQPQPAQAVCMLYIDFEEGRLKSVDGVDQAKAMPHVVDLHLNVKTGTQLEKMGWRSKRAGYVITKAGSKDEALQAAQKASGQLKTKVVQT